MTWHANLQPCSYLVVHLLGTGNFADMYLAEHTYPKTQVDLQVLLPQMTELAVKDFLAEGIHTSHRCILSSKRPVRAELLLLRLCHLAVSSEDGIQSIEILGRVGKSAINSNNTVNY